MMMVRTFCVRLLRLKKTNNVVGTAETGILFNGLSWCHFGCFSVLFCPSGLFFLLFFLGGGGSSSNTVFADAERNHSIN